MKEREVYNIIRTRIVREREGDYGSEIYIMQEVHNDFKSKISDKYQINFTLKNPRNDIEKSYNGAVFQYSVNIFVQNMFVILFSRFEKVLQNYLMFSILDTHSNKDSITIEELHQENQNKLFRNYLPGHIKMLKEQGLTEVCTKCLTQITSKYNEYNFLKHGLGSSFFKQAQDYKLKGSNLKDIPVKYYLSKVNKVIDTNLYLSEIDDFYNNCIYVIGELKSLASSK